MTKKAAAVPAPVIAEEGTSKWTPTYQALAYDIALASAHAMGLENPTEHAATVLENLNAISMPAVADAETAGEDNG